MDVAHFTLTRSVGAGAAESSLSAGPSVEALTTPVFFGCQMLETGMFYKQEADGIMGMQPPRARSRVPSMLSSLVKQRQAIDAFSLCLADRSGLFLLGGKPDDARLRARSALRVPMERNARARYTLSLRDVRVSGSGRSNSSFRSLGLPASTYSPTLVDSGTTFVYASTPLYRAIHAQVKQSTPTLQREGGKVCAYLTAQQLGAMPSIELVFSASSQPLLVRPHQYMVEFPKSQGAAAFRLEARKHYCVAVFDNQRGGTVIGASILRHREVVFDITNSVITFVDKNCEAATPAASYLRDPYTFAPCPAGVVPISSETNRSLAVARASSAAAATSTAHAAAPAKSASSWNPLRGARAQIRARRTATSRLEDASGKGKGRGGAAM